MLSAANAWDDHRMADAQLAAALSAHVPVLYVDPPQSVSSRLRSAGSRSAGSRTAGPRLALVAPRVARLTPEGLPGLSRARVATVNSRLIARQVAAALRRLGRRPAAVIEANLLSPVLGLADLGRRVYWAQDDFVAMAPLVGVDPRIFHANHERLTRDASVIVAANPLVAGSITAATGRAVELIPFGCDVTHFSTCAPARPAEPGTGTAVLMGTLNDRLDLGLLHAVAEAGVRLLVIGPRSPRYDPPGFAGLLAHPHVTWLGERPFAELPRHVAGAGVGLVPYTHSAFNEASFPLKTLEYLAAGLPVVATDLPAIRWLAAPDVRVADSAGSFASAVRDALDVSPAQAEAIRHRARATAQGHTWAARAALFAELLPQPVARAS